MTEGIQPVPAFGCVAIVGARGKMGGLFAERCREAGLDVRTLDRPLLAEDIARDIPDADLVMISVPVPVSGEVTATMAPHMKDGAVLADLGSVKVTPLMDMCKIYRGPIVGTHPLFGPEPPEQARVAVMPGGSEVGQEADGAACEAVEALMQTLGFSCFRTTPEAHDDAVAQIQGLNFVTTVSYLAALARQPEIENFLTPSFQRRLEAAQKMLTQDAELFTTLFEQNPYGQDAVRRYRNFLHVAAGGDMDLLVQHARWWWKDTDDDSRK